MIAAHYLDAFRADEAADDAEALEASALEWLVRAGERAAALAATQDARRAFDQASAIARDPLERAALVERAGVLAQDGDEREIALERLDEARRLYEAEGRVHDAARAAAEMSRSLWNLGRTEEAIALLDPAFELLAADEPDEDLAGLAAESARVHHFAGSTEIAMERVEFALEIAEHQGLPEVLSHALNTKALLISDRQHESRALLREALDIALEHDLVSAALRAYNNLLVGLQTMDRGDEMRRTELEGLELARRRGHRSYAIGFAGFRSQTLMWDGEWGEAIALAEDWLPTEPTALSSHAIFTLWIVWMHLERDEPAEARRLLALVVPDADTSSDHQLSMAITFKRMLIAIDEDRPDAIVDELVHLLGDPFPRTAATVVGFALDALQETGDVSALLPLVDRVDATPTALRSRQLEAEVSRARGVAASLAGDHEAAADWFGRSLSPARNLGEVLWIARTLADYARALVRAGRADEAEPLAAEARGAFERMGAKRALARLDAGLPAAVSA